MYFSLVPDPGYNISYLVSRGIDGEWNLFKGSLVETEDNRTSWTGITWGGLNYSIKGKVRQNGPLSLVELSPGFALIG